MDYLTYVQHVRHEGNRLAAVSSGNLSEAVPSCPGWSVRELVRHVAEVYEHKIACTALGHAPSPWPPEWPADRDPIEWLRDAHMRLLDMFDVSTSATPSATWWPPDQTVGFWARRMAHETAVHRFDAELAVGSPTTVNTELAIDGVDEILALMLAGDWSEDPDDLATGQHVAISTGGETWIVTLDRTWVSVTRDQDEAYASLGGEPSDVLLWLWGRVPDASVLLDGDEGSIRLLRSRLALATQ